MSLASNERLKSTLLKRTNTNKNYSVMSIQYSLIPNHLTPVPNDYMAIVQDQTTRTMDDIVE